MRSRNGHSRKMTAGALVSIVLTLVIPGCNSGFPTAVDESIFKSYPQEGDETSYGMPLSTKNAGKFLAYYGQYRLTPAQEAIKKEALTPLVAPCCDDNSMYTCCCPCNLAKTVWGLSAYLIAEENADALTVREAALQWLRFVRRDYYKVQELQEQGQDPRAFGLTPVDSCYDGRCGLPFRQGGCGGMGRLVTE